MSPQQQSGEKTEQATPKKKRDAREKGQVAKSQDMVVALSLVMLLGALRIFGSTIISNILSMFRRAFTWDIPEVMTISSTMSLAMELIVRFAIIMLPILGVAMLVGVLFNVLQVGFMFTPKAMAPKFSRVNPMAGFKRIFSKNTLIELFKSIIKIGVLGIVAYTEYQVQIQKTVIMMGETVDALKMSIDGMIDMIFAIGFKLALALIIMGPIDYFYQWRKHNKELMMTKQEIKDEYKLTEGDPQIKGRIKQKQREMSAMRMMQAMGSADVVITNPTHYAVALSYDDSKHKAPVIIAKGKDYLAQKLKAEADKLGIQKVENRQLAQYLYFFCDIGDEVPEEMYQAVAEVLAYIYKLRHGTQRREVR